MADLFGDLPRTKEEDIMENLAAQEISMLEATKSTRLGTGGAGPTSNKKLRFPGWRQRYKLLIVGWPLSKVPMKRA